MNAIHLDPLETIHCLIERLGLTPESETALKGAICVRGKRKGYLLRRAPKSDTAEYAAWQAAMLVCNPYAASVFGAIFASVMAGHGAIYNEVKTQLEAASDNVQRRFSYDRTVLENLGVY